MSIKSMTGHGSSELSSKSGAVSIELSSVNHKQFDLRLIAQALPPVVEAGIAERIRKRIARGSVTCRVKVECAAGAGVFDSVIDEQLAAAYAARLKRLAGSLKMAYTLSLADIAALPGVCRARAPDIASPDLNRLMFRCLDGALTSLGDLRRAEGAALQADLERRLFGLESLTRRIAERATIIPALQAEALRKRIAALGADINEDDPRLAKEVAFFADRCDISEELTRLSSHIGQTRGKLAASKPVGRTLDFLVQEMNREINTIGSKANDGRIARHVIQFKAELERIREQVQNVE
jgi:uncharacterized protein (TIGR00255 family)